MTLPTEYQSFVHLSRYARWRDQDRRRETWEETVTRYIDFWRGRFKFKTPKDEEHFLETLERSREAILALQVMPSMRAMMTAGPALEKDNMGGYNCAYVTIDHPHRFDEIMYMLMCGTGVGFSVESQYVEQLPRIPKRLYPTNTTVVVGDSKIGWATAFRELISLLYSGKVPQWDFTHIREAGSRLKTFGGRASGPEPLRKLFEFTVAMWQRAAGRKLTTLECHDVVCKTADITVVGGVRRSALISLSDLGDARMRDAKTGRWWETDPYRALANNSAVYTERPPLGAFLEEWKALYESKAGERGIFNREAIQEHTKKIGRRDSNIQFGGNPCNEIILRPNQLCVAGTTHLIIKSGVTQIEKEENKQIQIWNGNEWTTVIPRKTRQRQQLIRVRLSDGSYLDCTKDHRFSCKNRFETKWREVEAQYLLDEKYVLQLEPTKIEPTGKEEHLDAYTIGVAVGDGYVYRNLVKIPLYGKKVDLPVDGSRNKLTTRYKDRFQLVSTRCDPSIVLELKFTENGFDRLFSWNRESVLNFIAGMLDTDGSETITGAVRLYLSNENRARKLQLLLTANGIRSSVNLMQEKETITNYGIRSDDIWYLQITQCSEIPCHRLDTDLGHEPRFKGKYQTVRDIEFLPGIHDVYCFSEPKQHKALFNNVLTFQCNLTEAIIREDETFERLKKKLKLAAFLGTLQSTLTDFRYVGDEWKKNCEEERLLGVSLTGILDSPWLRDAKRDELEELRGVVVDTNAKWATTLGIPQSTATTCVKPSGTVSQLCDTASGIHPRYARHYIRTVRADVKDPLARMMKDAGFPCEPDVTKPDAVWVFSFPMQASEVAITRKEFGALDQLRMWLKFQRSWCEHKPSTTVMVREDEWMDVGAWVWKNFDEMTGVAFLPYEDHVYKQAPYQEITKEEYEGWMTRMPQGVEWGKLSEYEVEDETSRTAELSCVGGVCEL